MTPPHAFRQRYPLPYFSMKKFKKIICGLTATVMCVSLLSGCSSETMEKVELIGETISLEAEELSQEVMDFFGPMQDMKIPLNSTPFTESFIDAKASGTLVKKNSKAYLDYSNTADGYVMAKWLETDTDKRIMLRVECPDKNIYTYTLNSKGNFEIFPLSAGNGTYTVKIYKSVDNSSNKYSTVLTQKIENVKLKDEFAPFIRPNQYVNYKKDGEAVKLAAELCKGIPDNLDKVDAVYEYVVNHIEYDKTKAANISSGSLTSYLPNLEEVLRTKKGICFDYASLMAGMLRSQGVPVKLVVGYTGKAYHAWVNVWSEKDGWVNAKIYFNGEKWELMDPTFASNAHQSDAIMKYIGTGSNYSAKYLY